MKRVLLLLLILFFGYSIQAQFSRQDTLRGSITPERSWWDLNHYHLDIEVIPSEKKIEGCNTISYTVLQNSDRIQIDLQPPLELTHATQDGQDLDFVREEKTYFISLIKNQTVGKTEKLKVCYTGFPREAVRAPWDGGISWKKDREGSDFIASSCQGLGASVWWPCKDHMADEVDSMKISVEVPNHLMNVSNGRLRKVDTNSDKKTKTFHWAVKNPINNYGVNINIGNYVHWKETYSGEKGPLDVSYWALAQDEEKAREQFKEVPLMLDAFEHWFGPYPFYEDGYQLVQAPYLGMEHQSSVTYGNQFQKGYLGRDLSKTGWGLKFDFIIIHESGHEWWANNITHKDMADMWIHESFTNYSESLYLEYHHSKEAGQEYVRGTRTNIENRKAMIGPYGVNYEGYPGDVYYKGANVLNTLRTVLNDDDKWRAYLRKANEVFYHQTITSDDLEKFTSEFLGLPLENFYDQYLRDPRVPILEYYYKDGNLHYRWMNCIRAFDMPVDVIIDETNYRLNATSSWQTLPSTSSDLDVDLNFYVSKMKIR